MSKQKYNLSDAIDISKAVFYDLTAKRIRFSFQSLPKDNAMLFTAVEQADLVKHLYPQFSILQNSRQGRFAELRLEYV